MPDSAPLIIAVKGKDEKMRNSRRSLPTLLLLIWLLLLTGARVSYASELVYLPLQREGQASVAIDEKKRAAYVIDLGRGGDGDQIKLDNLSLLDRFERAGVADLFFVCSHPHSDHMGGIRALFQQPHLFFKDEHLTIPRFKSITLIDDGVPNNLSLLLQRSLGANGSIKINRISATNRNAFAAISQRADDVYIETIPYPVTAKAGPHGRAVITYIRLGTNSIVDFDDADSNAILKAVNTLKARGETEITTFVVPHHGSRYHDVAPILDLNPKYAIISVNPENRYGHPSPPILLKLMQKLRKENVLFTGSVENVVIDQHGVKSAKFTAANSDSYALFVAQNRVRAEKRGDAQDVEDCKLIQAMMRGDRGDPPASDTGQAGGLPPPGSRPGTPLRTLFEEGVRLNGSILQPEFEFGAISYGSDGAAALQSNKIFAYSLASSKDLTGQDVAVVVERGVGDSRNEPAKLSPAEAQSVMQKLKLLGSNANRAKNVYVYFSSPVGLRDVLAPAVLTNPQEVAALTVPLAPPLRRTVAPAPRPRRTVAPAPGRKRPRTRPRQPPDSQPPGIQSPGSQTPQASLGGIPKGGMVFLKGGKLFPVGEATELLGGTLDVCGTKFCVKTSGEDGSPANEYVLPFSPDPLFSEVWTRVVDQRIESFYLSINPTKQFLRNMNSGYGQIPSDRLRSGAGRAGEGIRTHEVVTAGNIEKTRIGQILWEADVAFKSASLGFDVLTGKRGEFGDVGSGGLAGQDSTAEAVSLNIPYRERWCRLYWTSGSQSIEVDKSSGRVSFKGKAVIARSEPMVMRNGELEDLPGGTWCGDTKSVAASLQRLANSDGPGPAVLKQLRELAEIQNFIRWTKDNGITTSEAFRRSIAQYNPAPGGEVPTWTSGIKSDPRVQVRQQGSVSSGASSNILHISLAELSTHTNCVTPYWSMRESDFPANGIHRGADGVWKIPTDKYPFVDAWMSTLARKIAACSGGELVSLSSVGRRGTVSPARQGATELGIRYHTQAIHMHGGVMLGLQRGFLETARQKGLLLGLNRKPYFQSFGGKLHFWNHTENHPRFGRFSQHVVIDEGSVTEVSAQKGRLTFTVKTQPGALTLQESRWGRADNFTKGVEWAGARHGSDGSLIWEKAAWPCAGSGGGDPVCVQVNEITLDELGAKIGGKRSEDSAVSLTQISENSWRVDLNISSVRAQLDRRWKEVRASDVNSHLSLVYEYAKWGFVAEALDKYLEIVSKIEGATVDTILRKLLEVPSLEVPSEEN